MKTTTIPEIVFHIFNDNDTSLIEKYNPCLMRKQYLINMKQEIIKQSEFNVDFLQYRDFSGIWSKNRTKTNMV